MVGGLDYAKSQFNRVTQARRQPGSTFKPFVYLAALERGFAPNSLIDDYPVSFSIQFAAISSSFLRGVARACRRGNPTCSKTRRDTPCRRH